MLTHSLIMAWSFEFRLSSSWNEIVLVRIIRGSSLRNGLEFCRSEIILWLRIIGRRAEVAAEIFLVGLIERVHFSLTLIHGGLEILILLIVRD